MKFRLSLLAAGLAVFAASLHAAPVDTRVNGVIRADKPGAVIDRNIYGHFSEHLGRCIYEGIWVGEDSPIPNTRGIRNDTVAALKAIKVPVLRWPGGCFADEYHWKDGIGPREKRPSMINTHWGGVVENNHFGTHEFLDLCEQIGTEPFISVNVGSGTIQEMREWIEYMTSDADSPMTRLRKANGREKPWKIKYLGLGNENWGCGGEMRPEYYADVYRRYKTYAKNYADNRLFRIACGASGNDYNWTETLMTMAGRHMDGLSLHYYTLPTGSWRGSKGSATDFDEDAWHTTLWRTLFIDDYIRKHSEIMDKHDPEKRIGLMVDEWGTWYDVEPGTNPGFLYQQNTLRDAIVAGLNLHVFHAHADRVRMANIAQVINVLQAMILTDKEKLVVTPTYHVFEMFTVHHDATSLPVDFVGPDYVRGDRSIPAASISASRDASGKIHVSLVNTDPGRDLDVSLRLAGVGTTAVQGRILTADTINAHNTFEAPRTIAPTAFRGASLAGDSLEVKLPARSVVVLELN
ncbi:alpha-L-arabinofuranosidase AbfB [Opitutales bacterium ASA1]|uniref:alpha-N-arabinofuranosidase n=1 Tax=Congregicoccus parvus TaxID=3081749 RepID=UPI002B2F97B9|nr:alpha-L-arabinofuranosidase AbfB [Opitutales bacterium ASA1]